MLRTLGRPSTAGLWAILRADYTESWGKRLFVNIPLTLLTFATQVTHKTCQSVVSLYVEMGLHKSR